MAMWRRPVRVVLVLFVVGLGLTVLFGLRERAAPVRAVVVERTDPDAVLQTRGSRIVQADSLGDNLKVVATRQLTYPDGRLRMLDGVEVTIESRDDRDGFTLVGTEASVNADQTEVELSGNVQFSADNGLEAHTETASYSQADAVVRMPGSASFLRDDMEATATSAEYDRGSDRLRLTSDARVTLHGTTTGTVIASQTAVIAQTDGFMTFTGNVQIDADARQMTATEARLDLRDESSQPEALELRRQARIVGSSAEPGTLREMSASDIRLGYDETGEALDTATLDGTAVLELYGHSGRPGTRIGSRAMEVAFAPTGDGVVALTAQDNVVLAVPGGSEQPAQRVSADTLQATSGPSGTLEQAQFEGAVEYTESQTADASGDTRVARSQRLETTLADGLSALEGATFFGDVTFEDSEMTGIGDHAHYLVGENTVELAQVGPAGQVPRVVDRRGSVQASTVRLGFDGPTIDAVGDVESVLSGGDSETDDVKRPGLLEGTDMILVTAGELLYDGAAETATYRGDAHLWQGDTDFRGGTIVLDESTGNLNIEGAARTQFLVTQINDDTGLPEESLTTGRSVSMEYADELRRVTYTSRARLTGPRADLRADEIQVFLHDDNNTLDRITASGEVTLAMTGRLVTGETLVYYDADGRYEMGGRPVSIIEEGDDGCRETTGRSLTFFITTDDVSVDGQSEARTETADVSCRALMRR